MRISDWSSDVCSSDLTHEWRRPSSKRSQYLRNQVAPKALFRRNLSGTMIDNSPFHAFAQYELLGKGLLGFETYGEFEKFFGEWEKQEIYMKRSEEHTSELQSLMRISYAVFCLKKKKQ